MNYNSLTAISIKIHFRIQEQLYAMNTAGCVNVCRNECMRMTERKIFIKEVHANVLAVLIM